ncbi:Uncharacterized protein TCM_044995 [Theobroma cacao]|uniref:Uncharacterized protein n=1 Tax=Theobroma cacao TaxID=3641 RepID=A0A061FR04_THECC|nr:Uncharacterized protein TCM_044995 [Theobroma cacao]
MLRMRHYYFANDYQTWKQIEDGPHKIEKDMVNWNSHDLDLIELNAKAMLTIFSALGEKQYNQVQNYGNAKEIWDKLDKLYDNQLREN